MSAVEADAGPVDEVSFFQINKDMDLIALGCTAPVGACHGTETPLGVLKLKPNGPTDMAALMANYTAVLAGTPPRVNKANPKESPLLTKPLATRPDVMHTGGKTYFKTDQDKIYQSWLQWIVCGAKFESVKISSCPTVMNTPVDMAGGGG